MLTRNKNRALQNILCNILNNPMNCIPCMYAPFLNNRFIMVFDTETTGLLPKPVKQITWAQYMLPSTVTLPPPPPPPKPYHMEFPLETLNKDYPYITQLSYIVYDNFEKKIVHSFNSYIQIPEHVVLSEEIMKLTNVTREKCDQGIPISEALVKFHQTLELTNVIVAHNIQFDMNMIKIECRRNESSFKNHLSMIQMFNDKKIVCTMMEGMKRFKLQKFPRLAHLYELLFNEEIENYNIPLHNSLVDSIVCLLCYLQMIEKEDITQQKIYDIMKIIII